jgi:7-cyano-7-deazaguanosine (preQ0) biosynthesis protein QueE
VWNETVRISEMFGPTIQGEGPHVGEPCLFIRVWGCPLSCPDCDTKYSWDSTDGVRQSVNWFSVQDFIQQHQTVKGGQASSTPIVLTGGEPLLYQKSFLFHSLPGAYQVDLETSGYHPVGVSRFPDYLRAFRSIVISPKIGGLVPQHLEEREVTSQLVQFKDLENVFWKFVVGSKVDMQTVVKFVQEQSFIRERPIYIMPFGTDRQTILQQMEWLAPMVADLGFLLTPRLHVLIWGNRRGV